MEEEVVDGKQVILKQHQVDLEDQVVEEQELLQDQELEHQQEQQVQLTQVVVEVEELENVLVQEILEQGQTAAQE